MKKLRSLVLVGMATVVLTSTAKADDNYVFGRGRAQAGSITEARPNQDTITDLHLDGIPEIGFAHVTPTSQLTLSYTLTAALHSEYASTLGQNLSLSDSTDLTPRTSVTFTAYAARSTLSSILLTQPASAGTAGLFPSTTTTIVTAGANQDLTHELSPRLRFDEETSANAYKALYPAVPSSSSYLSLGGGLERIWENDGLGGSLLSTYVHSKPDPAIASEQTLLVISGGPRWRRDWSRDVSSFVEAGASMVESLASSSDPYFAPWARARLLYRTEDIRLTFLATTGMTPNPLTGQLVQAHGGSINGTTPLSLSAHLFLEGSLGYTHGRVIDRRDPSRDLTYDSGLADVGLVWELTPYLETYVRYTLVAQGGAAASGDDPSFTRNSVLVGLQISSRPLITRSGAREGGQPATPQRVDRTDHGTHDTVTGNAPPTDTPARDAD